MVRRAALVAPRSPRPRSSSGSSSTARASSTAPIGSCSARASRPPARSGQRAARRLGGDHVVRSPAGRRSRSAHADRLQGEARRRRREDRGDAAAPGRDRPGQRDRPATDALKPYRVDTKNGVLPVLDGTGGELADVVARAKPAGIERFSVIGIDDFGNTTSSRLLRPVRLRRRAITIARNTVEFASLIAGFLLRRRGRAARARGQPGRAGLAQLQDAAAGAQTIVRAFVETPAGAPDERVTGRLIGRRDGVERRAARSWPPTSWAACSRVRDRRPPRPDPGLAQVLPPVLWTDPGGDISGRSTAAARRSAAGVSMTACPADGRSARSSSC